MGETQSRGCVASLGKGEYQAAPENRDAFEDQETAPSDGVSSLEPGWSSLGHGGDEGEVLLRMPRRDKEGRYYKVKEDLHPIDHPYENEEPKELERPIRAAPVLEVDVAVMDPSYHLNNEHGEFLAVIPKGTYAEPPRNSLFRLLADEFEIDFEKGKPLHSREYKQKGDMAEGNTLTKLGLRATGAFQGIWVLETPETLSTQRLVEAYGMLRRHTKAMAFFKESELIMPVIGWSKFAENVRLRDIIHQTLGLIFECYRVSPNLSRITFVLPNYMLVQEFSTAFKHEFTILMDLMAKVYPQMNDDAKESDNNRVVSEVFDRQHVVDLVEILGKYEHACREYVDLNEGNMSNFEDMRQMHIIKIVLYHMEMILDGFNEKSSDRQFIRVLTASCRAIGEAFFMKHKAFAPYNNLKGLDNRLQYLASQLDAYGQELRLTPADFEQIKILLTVGHIVKDTELTVYLNAVDVTLSLEAILKLVRVFISPRGPVPDDNLPDLYSRTFDPSAYDARLSSLEGDQQNEEEAGLDEEAKVGSRHHDPDGSESGDEHGDDAARHLDSYQGADEDRDGTTTDTYGEPSGTVTHTITPSTRTAYSEEVDINDTSDQVVPLRDRNLPRPEMVDAACETDHL